MEGFLASGRNDAKNDFVQQGTRELPVDSLSVDREVSDQYPAWPGFMGDECLEGLLTGQTANDSTGSFEVLLLKTPVSRPTDIAREVAAVSHRLQRARIGGVDDVSFRKEADTLRDEIKRKDIYSGEVASLVFLKQINQQMQEEEKTWAFDLIKMCDSRQLERHQETIRTGLQNGQDSVRLETTNRTSTYVESDIPAVTISVEF